MSLTVASRLGAACIGGLLALSSGPASAWEPTHPIELIVPAGTGGWRGPDGPRDAGHHHQTQSVQAVRVFWSNALVSTIMTLGLIALFWPLIQAGWTRLRGASAAPSPAA